MEVLAFTDWPLWLKVAVFCMIPGWLYLWYVAFKKIVYAVKGLLKRV